MSKSYTLHPAHSYLANGPNSVAQIVCTNEFSRVKHRQLLEQVSSGQDAGTLGFLTSGYKEPIVAPAVPPRPSFIPTVEGKSVFRWIKQKDGRILVASLPSVL